MKRIGIAIIAVLFFTLASSAGAGLYWESNMVTKNVPGKKDETRTIKNFVTEYASRTENESEINILDCETMTMYRLDKEKKTYSSTDMRVPEEQEPMMKQMFGEIKVTPTKETKTIEGHDCVKHVVSFMMTSTDYWVAKDVKEFAELSEIGTKMSKVFEKNPMLRQINIAGMGHELNGFPLMIEANMMGGTMTQTIKNVEKRAYEKEFFQVPKEYQLENRKKTAKK